MQCAQCGAALPPDSGFCGSCGRPVAAPPAPGHVPHGGYPPPGQHGHPPQQHFAHAPPPQHAYPPPQQPGHPQQPGYGQQPGYPAPQPAGFPQAQSASLKPYPIVMQQRLTRLTGQMFVAPTRLYFICESQKGGMAVAMGKAVGGLIGGVIGSIGVPVPGQAAPVIDEVALQQAVQQHEGSLIMEPHQIKAIKDTFWTHAIWFKGKTYALPGGLGKALKPELGRWCQTNNVKHAGLLPK